VLDCDRMSEKIMLKIFQAFISSSVGVYKLINEARSTWSLMDEKSANNTDRHAR